MRRILFIILAILFLISTTPASARTIYKRLRKSVTTNTALTLPAGTWVYGIGIHATSAAAQMGIYDSATLGAATTPIDEAGEAVQYNTVDRPWIEPILFVNGVTVLVTNGVAFIDYASSS